jgi:hypothetical protein
MATVGWRRPEFSKSDLIRSKSRMFCDQNKTMRMRNSRTARRSVDANEQARERAKTTPLRNEAPLNCVSLRSQLDCEVTGEAVKGQDERQLQAPLTAPPVTTGSIQHGRKLVLSEPNTRKTEKSGGAVGRPGCQSSLLSDPKRKIFCGNVAKATKNKKSKEGRHVGLDFYDLLIEAHHMSG